MVAGPLVLARHLVNHAGAHLRLEGITDQNVVDAHASVAGERKAAVVPPGKAFLGVVKQPVGIMQAQRNQREKVVEMLLGGVNGVLER